jgi:CRP-like cAMP-binding protein
MSTPVEKIKAILNKPSNSRTGEDIREIAAQIYNIKFFESLRENKPVFGECCAYLTYECFGPDEFIFKLGDYGDKFYILIQGEVSVLVPVKSDSMEMKEIIKFKSGSSFGDLALIDNKPRAASIRTLETCHFAVLDRSNYQRILASIMKQKKMELVDFLQTQSIFKSFTKGSLAKLSYCFEEKNFGKDFILFHEGNKVDFLYLVKSGEVKLTKKIVMKKVDFEGCNKYKDQLNKKFTQKAEISLMGEGEFLGVYDIEKGFYANTAICSSKLVTVLKLSINDFTKRLNIREITNTIKQRKQLKDAIHESSILSITKAIHERESSPFRKINLSQTPNNKQRNIRERFSPTQKFTFDRFSAISRQKIENESKSMTEYLISITKGEIRPKSHAKLNFEKGPEDHGIKNSTEIFFRLEPFGKKKKIFVRKHEFFNNIHKTSASIKNFQASRFFAKTRELLNERLLQSKDNE